MSDICAADHLEAEKIQRPPNTSQTPGERPVEEHDSPTQFPLAVFQEWDSSASDLSSIDNLESITLEDVFDIEELDTLLSSFSKATGVAAVITNLDGSPYSGSFGFTRFCRLVRSFPEGLRNCYRSDALFGDESMQTVGPVCHKCYSGGLYDSAAALRLPNGIHIGNVLAGQVAPGDCLDFQRNYLTSLGAEAPDIEDALTSIYYMSIEQFRHIAHFLFKFTSKISDSGYYGLLQRQYIRQLNIRDLELRFREAQLRGTLDSIEQAVIVLSADGIQVVRCNEAANILFSQQLTNKKLPEVMHFLAFPTLDSIPDPTISVLKDNVTVRSMHDCAICIGEPDDILRTSEGVIRKFLHSCTPLEGEGLHGCVLVIAEVTNQRKMQAQLAENSKFELLGRFSAFVSHNANQYLQGIAGCAESLLMDHPTQVETDLLSTIVSSSLDCSNLINRMLSVTSANQGLLVYDNVDVVELISSIQSIVASFDPNVTVTSTCSDPVGECFVKADSSQLQSAFLNLCVNSLEAIQEGYQTGNIDIIARRRILRDTQFHGFTLTPGEFICITIKDDGIGIPAKNISKVFNPFWSSKTIRSGTGVGLASVRAVIMQHSGAIMIKSQERTETNRGRTMVHVYLPLLDKEIALKTRTLRCDPQITSPAPIPSRKKIVLIDDTQIVLQAVSSILRRLNCDVMTFQKPHEAIDELISMETPPDLIIIDMLMPEINGIETFQRLREGSITTPVVFASGYKIEELYMPDLEAKGVIGFLKKPFTANELRNILNSL